MPAPTTPLFSLLHSNQWGIDLYSSAVSNPYQDLFGHGIFCGEGDLRCPGLRPFAAEAVSENAILSHDLLEGGFLRAGLVSDIELQEDFLPPISVISPGPTVGCGVIGSCYPG